MKKERGITGFWKHKVKYWFLVRLSDSRFELCDRSIDELKLPRRVGHANRFHVFTANHFALIHISRLSSQLLHLQSCVSSPSTPIDHSTNVLTGDEIQDARFPKQISTESQGGICIAHKWNTWGKRSLYKYKKSAFLMSLFDYSDFFLFSKDKVRRKSSKLLLNRSVKLLDFVWNNNVGAGCSQSVISSNGSLGFQLKAGKFSVM